MKISERWLREWTDPAGDVHAIAETLTLGGLEVDDIAPAGPRLDGVVVGEVRKVAAHEDAANLRVCEVFDGTSVRQVVCGAPNVRPGLKTALAQPGTTMPGGQAIAVNRIRGVESQGMLCSLVELGLGDDASGIVELPTDSTTGVSLASLFALDDHVLDVNLTPNRGDCFSVLGIARDLAVLSGSAMKSAEFLPVTACGNARVHVDLADGEGCPRYAGRAITGINAGATTPLWMRERLRRAGVRVIHPVVDITNYVMLELGQPMHAFDMDRLSAPIVVRGAHAGEHITLLDGNTLALTAGSLLIADQSGPIALAGVMGGASTAVSAATVNVFFESAFFEPVRLAGVARRYHMHTDASQRFERGVDPARQVRAVERATALLLEICGGVPGPTELTEASARTPTTISFRPHAVARLLGVTVEPARVAAILRGLELEVDDRGDAWHVTVPSFRFDLAIEADLVEEVARVIGYDAIPVCLPSAAMQPAAALAQGRVAGQARNALCARGYFEAITYSFIEPELAEAFDPAVVSVPLANPISREMSVLRRSLWPGLVAAARHNLNRQSDAVSLFEFGMVFQDRDGDLLQYDLIGGLRCGPGSAQHWSEKPRDVDFFDLKQDVEALLHTLGKFQVRVEPGNHHALHPGQCAAIVDNGVTIGHLGALHPAIASQLGIAKPLFLFELEQGEALRASAAQFHPISKFPAVRRDIAVVVAENVSAANCLTVAREAAGQHLRDLQLFDVYRGQGIDSGKKSLALGLIFQALSSTLTDDEVDQAVNCVVAQLRERVGGTLRA